MADFGHPGWAIHETTSDEMDLLFHAPNFPWRMRIRRESYEVLKDLERTALPDWHGELFYKKDGVEYYRAVDNHVIPFLLHYRVIIDDSLSLEENYGTKIEMDDEVEPDVHARYDRESCADTERRRARRFEERRREKEEWEAKQAQEN